MSDIVITVTDQARQRLFAPGGIAIRFSRMAMGRGSYDADGSEAILRDVVENQPVADSKRIEGGVNIASRFSNLQESYDVSEIGVYAEQDGDEFLFGIAARASEPYFRRSPIDATFKLGLQFVLQEAEADRITVDGVGEELNLNVAEEIAKLTSAILELQYQVYQLRRERGA